jgi:hypothetical protein
MKTILSLLVVHASLGLADIAAAATTGTTTKVVVCQPAKTDLVPDQMAALKGILAKYASGKGHQLELHICNGAGATEFITTPKLNGVLVSVFGDQTPSACKERLELYLAALEAKLKAGANKSPVPLAAVQKATGQIFTESEWIACSLVGTAHNPWNGSDGAKGPATYLPSATALEEHLAQHPGSSILLLLEPVEAPAPKSEPPAGSNKLAKKEVPKKKAKPIKTKQTEKSNSPIPTETPRPRDIRQLIANAEKVGDVFYAKTGQYAPDKAALLKMLEQLNIWKAQGETLELFLVACADAEPGSTPERNHELSQKRAEAVIAWFLAHGITIPKDNVLSIGDALADGVVGIQERKLCLYAHRHKNSGSAPSKVGTN